MPQAIRGMTRGGQQNRGGGWLAIDITHGTPATNKTANRACYKLETERQAEGAREGKNREGEIFGRCQWHYRCCGRAAADARVYIAAAGHLSITRGAMTT